MRASARHLAERALGSGDRVGGKLCLTRPLAEGGMGSLWVATNVTTGAEVALKMLRRDRAVDEYAMERFRHEARLGATLSHRNITRVYDLLEEPDGTLVLVMELLRGDTLARHLERRGSLSTEEAVAIVLPILSALQHAHEHGIIHRDLKPSNIVLHVDPDGQVTPKLVDFGIARVNDPAIHTRTGDTLGTPSYMSPEQVRAKKELDGRSDLFSIGTVLYELVTGTNPFHASAPSAALAHVLEQEVDPDPRIDPRVWLEIQRVLSKQSYARHASAVELATALCAALETTESALSCHLRQAKPVHHSEVIARDPHALRERATDRFAPAASAEPTPVSHPALPPTPAATKRLVPILAVVAAALAAMVGYRLWPSRPAPAPELVSQAPVPARVEMPPVTASAAAPSPPRQEPAVVAIPPPVRAESPRPEVKPSPVPTTRRSPDPPKPSSPAGPSTSIARTPGF